MESCKLNIVGVLMKTRETTRKELEVPRQWLSSHKQNIDQNMDSKGLLERSFQEVNTLVTLQPNVCPYYASVLRQLGSLQ